MVINDHIRSRIRLFCPTNSSCCWHGLPRVLAQQAAQSLAADDWSDSHDRIGASDRYTELKPAMRSCLVVVLEPLGQHVLRVPLVDDQKPI